MSAPTITPLTGFSILRFSGEKTEGFLQGQLTCDMRLLSAHGDYSFAACCDHRGRMFANFWVVNWQQDFLLILPKNLSDIIKNHLQKYAAFSKVSITADDHFFIAELNNDSDKKNNAIYITLPNSNRYLILAEKNPFPEMNINHDETNWRKKNIADQFAILSDKTSLLFTPQMINLEKIGGVSFTKGCYVGQEIVARTQHLGILKRHLHRLTIHTDQTLNSGDALKNENGDTIGVVVDAILLSDNTTDILAVIEDRYASLIFTYFVHVP
jgi:hypothetical protein